MVRHDLRHLAGYGAIAAAPALVALLVAACGAKTALTVGEPDGGPPPVDGGADVGPRPDVGPDAAPDAAPDGAADVGPDGGCIPVDDLCARREECGDGDDDDCDGEVDEGCPCEPGSVQSCFRGPPGRRHVGACDDGEQTCHMSGNWGSCEGGIWPREDVCNGLDNLCDGCSQRYDCEIDCPGPGDPRVAEGAPLQDYPLRGRELYPGLVRSWRWDVQGGPCDGVAPRFSSFELSGALTEAATLTPRLSGDYTVNLTVVTEAGTTLSCSWIVHVRGPGLRVEMCYPESEYEDLDLFVKQPGAFTPWYPEPVDLFDPSEDQCGWHNCEATIRGTLPDGGLIPRADWGYPPSDLSECIGGPLGDQWSALGFCANPRLDIDNNLSEGTGLPENINIDAPREGERFRIMIESFTGGRTRPLVNVYCGGRRVATLGAPPDEVPDFSGISGGEGLGAMWRVADVTTHVDAAGTVTCEVDALHPPGSSTGYFVTRGDPSY